MVGDNTQTTNFATRNSRIVLMVGVLVHLLFLFSLVLGFLNPLFAWLFLLLQLVFSL